MTDDVCCVLLTAFLLSFGKEKLWLLPFEFHLADTVLFVEAGVQFASNEVFLSFLSLQGAPGTAAAGMKVSFTPRCRVLSGCRLRTRAGVRREQGRGK